MDQPCCSGASCYKAHDWWSQCLPPDAHIPEGWEPTAAVSPDSTETSVSDPLRMSDNPNTATSGGGATSPFWGPCCQGGKGFRIQVSESEEHA